MLRGLVIDRRLEVTAEVVWLRRQGRLIEGRSVGESASRTVADTARVAVLDRAKTVGAGRGCKNSCLVGDGVGSEDVRGLVCQSVCRRDQLDRARNLGALDALTGRTIQIMVLAGSPSGGESTDKRHVC